MTLTFLITFMHIIGALHAMDAVMKVRTSQGAIAWGVSLCTLPFVAVPLYWIFGRSRIRPRQRMLQERRLVGLDKVARAISSAAIAQARVPEDSSFSKRLLETLSGMPFTAGNHVEILIDGQATFDAIFAAIREARDYVLIQFFIIRDDSIGARLRDLLLEKAAQGVEICLLYDALGSYRLPAEFVRSLTAGGIHARSFGDFNLPWERFRINFRNHRKIVIVDGAVSFVGGHNVGDEYMGASAYYGHWRDTHVRISGPATLYLQAIFASDWYSVTEEIPGLTWSAPKIDGDRSLLIVPASPADTYETNSLFFTHLIDSARRRIWLSSAYFVPDSAVTTALLMAALRGVDVRVMIPKKIDHYLAYFAAHCYLPLMEQAGIKMLRYQDGFLHQKAALIDDDLSVIGTANLDSRSCRLNFEVSVLCAGRESAAEVEKVFLRDFEQCRPARAEEYLGRAIPFRFAAQLSKLLSPVL